MIKVMFVCLGNICRSPMAEYIFKALAARRGGDFLIASSGTSDEEEGNPLYPPAAATLTRHGIPFGTGCAARFTREDYDSFDYVLCMETGNVRALRRMTDGDPRGTVRRLLDYAERPRDISDPWYTRDFEAAYRDIAEGCEAFYHYLEREGKLS